MAKAKKAKKTKRIRRSRKQVRVAFVGAGGRARRVHYPSLAANPDAKIVAVSDLDEERLQTVTEEYGIPGRYTDYKQMIEKEKPDVVYAIMSPQYLYDVAATVLEMVRNLVVEKPPAINSEQTRQLAILARKNKALTGVTFQRRYCPVVRRGKALCEKRGPVHSAGSTFYKHAVGGSPYSRGAIDILSVDAVHAVDTLRY
ncbi:MAG: Gfo/Idh/MocA family oxidoreductase, partial [bacterium]|nr:Gfo/Idh/MocA family oxidoreductase [bacterium]